MMGVGPVTDLILTYALTQYLEVKWTLLITPVRLPVLWVRDGIDDGVMDGRGLGDDSRNRIHVGSQHVCIPAAERIRTKSVGFSSLTLRTTGTLFTCQGSIKKPKR